MKLNIEFLIILYSILFGSFLYICHLFKQILLAKRHYIINYLSDLLFWIIAIYLYQRLVIKINYGIFSFYFFFLIAIGYFVTLHYFKDDVLVKINLVISFGHLAKRYLRKALRFLFISPLNLLLIKSFYYIINMFKNYLKTYFIYVFLRYKGVKR